MHMNKIKIYISFALFISLVITEISSAQNDQLNHQKYWYYRWRLRNDFMIVGDCEGCSLPARERFGVSWDSKIKWGEDGTIALGEYIGMLATEYHLLKHYGQSTEQTRKELFYALKAINRLDLAAEPYMNEQYNWWNGGSANCQSKLDGFFIRGDVKSNFVSQNYAHFNQTKTALQHYVNNQLITINATNSIYEELSGPNLYYNEMSQDQVYGLLVGLRLVREFVDYNATYNNMTFNEESSALNNTPVSSLQQEAKNITNRMWTYMSQSSWYIKRPACIGGHVQRGAQAAEFSWPISKIVCDISTKPGACFTGSFLLNQPGYDIWKGVCAFYNNAPYGYTSKFMVMELMASGGELYPGITIVPPFTVPGDRIYLTTNAHVINTNSSLGDHDYEWMSLMHSVIKNYSPNNSIWPQKITNYLDKAPCLGPYFG